MTVMCELTWCKHNSEAKNEQPDGDHGTCQHESLIIIDKGYGPKCNSFQEVEE
jgi:hypothetical protein